jgi:hypothetical protein
MFTGATTARLILMGAGAKALAEPIRAKERRERSFMVGGNGGFWACDVHVLVKWVLAGLRIVAIGNA